MVERIRAGSIQLLVGPASSGSGEQTKVRSSTLATSPGSEAHQNEFGLAVSGTNVPARTSLPVSRCHSPGEPSHQTTRSGMVSVATYRTQESSPAWLVGGWSSPVIVLMPYSPAAIY